MTPENFHNVNHLVLNFYPDGYSIAVKLNEFPVFTSETILETAKISYEETSLLDYIENEELPPLLVEMIDASPKLSQYKIWHNGCLVLEVRDKIYIRQNGNKVNHNHTTTPNCSPRDSPGLLVNGFESRWGPNHQPDEMISDNNNIQNAEGSNTKDESNSWSTHERLQLESQIVLYNSPQLCLEPDLNSKPQWINNSGDSQNTWPKKRLPYKKLMDLCPTSANGCNDKQPSQNGHKSDINPSSSETLPPELTLQQFLANKRSKKSSFAACHLARFHRFKKFPNNNIR